MSESNSERIKRVRKEKCDKCKHSRKSKRWPYQQYCYHDPYGTLFDIGECTKFEEATA